MSAAVIYGDLCPDADAQEGGVDAETLSEQRRLLYVALTRPIFKLYVPRVKVALAFAPNMPGRSARFCCRALDQACPRDKLGPLIADVITPPLAVAVPKALRQSRRRSRSWNRRRSASQGPCLRRLTTI